MSGLVRVWRCGDSRPASESRTTTATIGETMRRRMASGRPLLLGMAIARPKRQRGKKKKGMLKTPAELLNKGSVLHPKSRKVNQNIEEVLNQYHLEDEDYRDCARLAGHVTSIVKSIKSLPESSDKRRKCTNVFIDELYEHGLIPTKMIELDELEGFPASAFARRQFWVVAMKKRLGDSWYTTHKFIREGQIMIGTEVITDPKMFVNRELEAMIKWNPESPVRERIQRFHGTYDDFEVAFGDDGILREPIAERDLEPEDYLNPRNPFPLTEKELVMDKIKMLNDPYLQGKVPKFSNMKEMIEYQEKTMFDTQRLGGGDYVVTLNEPYATWVAMARKKKLRTVDEKLARVPAAPDSLTAKRRRRMSAKLHSTTKQGWDTI